MKITLNGKFCKMNFTGWSLGIDYDKKILKIAFCRWMLIFDWRKSGVAK